MNESLVNTYVRLKRNVTDAKAKVAEDPSIKNMDWFRLTTNTYYDFCATFTENILSAISQTTDEIRYL